MAIYRGWTDNLGYLSQIEGIEYLTEERIDGDLYREEDRHRVSYYGHIKYRDSFEVKGFTVMK